MDEKSSESKLIKKERDIDLMNAEKAMKRAALKARERARAAGVNLVFFKDGKVVEEHPDHPHQETS